MNTKEAQQSINEIQYFFFQFTMRLQNDRTLAKKKIWNFNIKKKCGTWNMSVINMLDIWNFSRNFSQAAAGLSHENAACI